MKTRQRRDLLHKVAAVALAAIAALAFHAMDSAGIPALTFLFMGGIICFSAIVQVTGMLFMRKVPHQIHEPLLSDQDGSTR